MAHYTAVDVLRSFEAVLRFNVPVRYPTTLKERSLPNGTEVLRRLICNARNHRALKVSRELLRERAGEYSTVWFALKNLVYPRYEDGRLDEKYLKDGTNDHPVDALRYQMVMQFMG